MEVLVYYDLWSPYRTRGSVPMTFTGYFPSKGVVSQGAASAVPVLKLTSKGVPGSLVQTIEYVGLADRMTTTIVGGYVSVKPDDVGGFSITRR